MAVNQIMMFHMAVTDMAKSKDFYTKLGFTVVQDYGQGDQHWVSLTAPGGGASLNLTTAHEHMKPGTMKLYLSADDVEATHDELEKAGLKVSKVGDDLYGPGSGAKWFSLSDPDDNKWMVAPAK